MAIINIENLLKENKLNYKKQEYEKDINIFKIGESKKINFVVIEENNSTFSLDRELFYYLDNQNITYCFLLINKIDTKLFYLEFKNKINWLSSSFNNSDKENLYFGKIVLNHEIDEDSLLKKITNLVK